MDNHTKKTLIVSPYLDHLGGGERYMLSIASVLESLGHKIYIAWDNTDEIMHLATMFGLTLTTPALDPLIQKLYFARNSLAMYRATRAYDVVVYLSDGSIPLLGGKRNLIHMQVPFHGVGGKSWQNQLKKNFIHGVVVNSKFTQNVVNREYALNSHVLYPPVVPIAGANKKDQLILSVGRFEPSLNTKHQDVLIEAFKLLCLQQPNWRLVLAGGSTSDDWISHLKQLAGNLPIEFATNVSYPDLIRFYQQASIYWHAAGYLVDEHKNPELTEHFGISTVEAISAGCLPLVVPYGGQREIIADPAYHWENIPELVQKTTQFIAHPVLPSVEIAPYSFANFSRQLSQLL